MKKQLTLLIITAVIVMSCTDHSIEGTAYSLDATKSVAEWKGFLKTGYFNEGSISVKSDGLTVKEGKVTGGSFVMPLLSIVNFNLPSDDLKMELITHLQSADFFNMALHPDLKFGITNVTVFTGSGEGVIPGANYQVNGTLTMLGISKPVSFPAKIICTGNDLALEATLQVDRTQWGITFASDPALPPQNFIEPLIDIHLKLAGSKQ